MAQATMGHIVTDHDEPAPPAPLFSRNEDPLTRALRAEGSSGQPFGIEDLVLLNQTAAAADNDTISLGSCTTEVFSSREPSTTTKPTSHGTSYINGYTRKGKCKVVSTYASSLSATHGSDSDNEAGQDNSLVGVGDWAATTDPRPLKGAARTRKRTKMNRHSTKKPVVIIQRKPPYCNPSPVADDGIPATKQISRRNGRESKYLRQRLSTADRDGLSLAEEGRVSVSDLAPVATHPSYKPLSRVRIQILIGLAVTLALTISLTIFAAHYTGKTRLACTKGIVFTATVLVAFLTVLALITARRAPQEALLAGLLELLTGFVLLVELDDFMY